MVHIVFKLYGPFNSGSIDPSTSNPIIAVMQIVRLFDASPKNPNGWHRVASPGGYEIWNFEAVDPSQQIRLSVRFHQGGDFSGNYRRRYKSYLTRPTRRLPPLPAEFPGVQILVSRGKEITVRHSQIVSPNDFSVADDSSQIVSGLYRMKFEESRLQIDLDSFGHLIFDRKPCETISDHLLPLYTRPIGSEHHWIISEPVCPVVLGEIQTAGGNMLKFSGRGFCDHRYGTGPWAYGATQWICGTALFSEQSIAFRAVIPKREAAKCFCITANTHTTDKIESDISDWKWDGRGNNGVAFPAVIQPSLQITLDQPEILLEEEWSLLLRYRAQIGAEETLAYVETGTRAK